MDNEGQKLDRLEVIWLLNIILFSIAFGIAAAVSLRWFAVFSFILIIFSLYMYQIVLNKRRRLYD